MGRLWRPAIAALLTASLVSADPYTPKHEAGRCAIRGTCGKDGWLGPELPCPDNGLATEPEDDVREQLVELCGTKWTSGPVCCEGKQVCLTGWAMFEHLLISIFRSTPSRKTSRKRSPLYPHVRHAKRTSIIFSAPSPALRTNRCS